MLFPAMHNKFRNVADVAAAGVDALVALGLFKPQAQRIVNKATAHARVRNATLPSPQPVQRFLNQHC